MSSENTRKRFGDVASFSRGLTFAKGDVATDTTKCVLRSNNIDLTSHSLDLGDIACLKEDYVIPDDKKLHKGDIFICMSNGSTQHLGKVAFIDEDMDYAFGGFMGAIHPDRSIVSPKYAFYACLSAEYRHFLSSVFNGININNLKWSDLSRFTFPVPPLPEQERIVAELDLLSGIIDKYKQQLKELDNLAQSIFYDMFGDPENSPFPVKTMNELSVSKLSYGSGASSCPFDGNIRYVRITDIDDNGELNQDKVSPSDYDERYLLSEGDILFARSGATIGKTYLYSKTDGKAIYAGYLIRVVPDKKWVLPRYLFNFTKTSYYKRFISLNARAVAQPNINAKQYGSLMVVVPPLDLQKEFANKTKAIEQQKELIKRSIAETEMLFNSRMDYWFN